jgi:hypothetical protein
VTLGYHLLVPLLHAGIVLLEAWLVGKGEEGVHHNEESSNGSDKGRGVWEKRIHRSRTGDKLNSYLTMLLV